MRISSTGTKFYVQADDLPAGSSITSATKAKPCVLSMAAAPTGAVVGALVQVAGSGWRSLDNLVFEIEAVSGAGPTTITLHDSDTSDEETTLLTGATMSVVPMSEACMATLTFNSPAGAVVDVTTLCDQGRETVSGMPAISTWQATGFWDKDDAVQSRLRDLYRSGERVAFKVVFLDGSGLAFRANVNTYDVRAGVDQAVAITVGGSMSGLVSALGTVPASLLLEGLGLAAEPTPPPPAPPAEPAQAAA